MIHDEFTNLNLSKQRKQQLRYRKAGVCVYCGKDSGGKECCPKHAKIRQNAARKRRLKRGLTKDKTSVGETEFLNHFLVPLRQVIVNDHAVDGLKEQTVFEFLGDYWHGNPTVYERLALNTKAKKTFGELYDKTLEKFDSFKKLGYTVQYIWEKDWCEFKKGKTANPNVITH